MAIRLWPKAIAAHHGLIPTALWNLLGTSMANHLAMASILEPGDEVLIEHPAYGPILDIARYLYADVKRFRRTEENGWAIDPEEVRRCITPKTRLIVITNLHNPTSALRQIRSCVNIGDIARSVGALPCSLMKFIWMRFTTNAANIVPSWTGIRCDQQPDEGLRRQRTAMWLDSGAA